MVKNVVRKMCDREIFEEQPKSFDLVSVTKHTGTGARIAAERKKPMDGAMLHLTAPLPASNSKTGQRITRHRYARPVRDGDEQGPWRRAPRERPAPDGAYYSSCALYRTYTYWCRKHGRCIAQFKVSETAHTPNAPWMLSVRAHPHLHRGQYLYSRKQHFVALA